MTRRRWVAALLASSILVAACSSGGGSASSTSGSVPVATSSPASTPDSSSSTVPGTDTPGTATVDTVYSGPVYPLTGLPATDAAAAARPALVVKIDNNALARPQSGLDEADIVFEEIVEVQTRFAAVFQSHGADPVGPIRSGRTQDIALLGSFHKPLFAWSGGNSNVTKAIASSDLVNLSAQKLTVYQGGGFFRSNDRSSPHNLYASTSKLWSLAPAGSSPPPQQFHYRAPGDTVAGQPASGVTGDMDGLRVDWTWDATSGLYSRRSGGAVHSDALSGPVTTDNVVVMEVAYKPSPADARSPEAQTIGSGTALVFSGGAVVQGTWTRHDRFSPVVLTDASGATIQLTPGRTWIELARAGTFSAVS